MLADAVAETDRTWDLSHVESFVNAGEQVTLPVVSAFIQRMAPFGVPRRAMQPAYGMAELWTAMRWESDFDGVTSVHRVAKDSLATRLRPARADEPAVTFVDCGRVASGVQVRIVDRANQLLPEDTIGCLQIRGRVVTPGYLNNPAAN